MTILDDATGKEKKERRKEAKNRREQAGTHGTGEPT
jgi:hypothetical protein